MEEKSSLINIGDLAQPATTLIEKIADATGVIFEPWKIKRNAKAEAEASLIKAKSEIEISDLQKRALNRFVQEEGKKQENFETIMGEMIPLLEEGSKPNEINDDWLMNFVDKAKLVSDEEMKTLWAKTLAGEANQPNSFSKRTVNFLASMDKKDAETFSNLCRFNVIISGDTYPLVYEVNDSIYDNSGIDYAKLTHLDSIGLIRFNNIATTSITETDDISEINCSYFEHYFQIIVKSKENNGINVGFVMLTQLGLEMSKLCKTEIVTGFFDYLIGKLKETQNLEIKMIDASTKGTQQTNFSVSISTSEADFVKIFNGAIDGGEF